MAAYLAVVAALDTLRRAVAPRGITRFVIVQPSFYGTDNALLMESLDALGGDGRGVAVIDPAATPRAVLADYTARGVRGLRINLYSRLGGQSPQGLDVAFTAMAQVALTWAGTCRWSRRSTC